MSSLTDIINSPWLTEFLTIALLHALAVISPGPDFAIVIKQSVSYGRLMGRMTALGVGLAILWHVAYSLIGVGILANNSEWLFEMMKYLAAAYLIFIGYGAIRTTPLEPLIAGETKLENRDVSIWSSFRIGFLTNGLNPKAALFFISLFTVVIQPSTPITVQMAYGIYLALATAFWFVIVATIFSQQKVRDSFQKMGHWFDRLMGLLLIILGLNIGLSSLF